MRGSLDLDLVFPARDAASAELMRLKADCLYAAGIIDAPERRRVHARCAAVSVESAIEAWGRPMKAPRSDHKRKAA